jgi:hypothetical protein
MKFFTGCVAAAALVWAATAADAQGLANGPMRGRYIAVSDFDGPYAPPPRVYGYGYEEERGPVLLPAVEVYAVLRENGFLPLGIPRLRGSVYTIAAVDRRGEDGRLVIDARDGRILRFMPAYGPAVGTGPAYDEPAVGPYGPQSALPPPTAIRSAVPRPPAPIPHVASRTVPVPRAAPARGEAPAVAARPAPAEAPAQAQAPQQSAAVVQPKPAEPAAAPQAAAPTIGQAKPAPAILPTQDMPPAQGLE